MDLPQAFEQYRDLIKIQEPLSSYSYMKVGGPADYLAVCTAIDDLLALVNAAKSAKILWMIIGSGSNVIFADEGYRGLIIVNRCQSFSVQEDKILVGSGEITNAVVNKSLSAGLQGLELFLGIPGTIGGAVYNNSHYSTDLIGNHISRVKLLHTDGTSSWVSADELEFGYDYSRLQKTKEIVLEVEFSLKLNADIESLSRLAKQALLQRRSTQPLELPSSGCMFKNPVDRSAGSLIDKAGLKGYRIGGAEVSQVHANFIVNDGTAKTKDIIDLSEYIVEKIRDLYGITLHREVFMINEYGERLLS